MSYWYPQAIATLRVLWEDFGDKASAALKEPYSLETEIKRGRVTINSYTEADTFEIELDYKTFPFDPRAIKACQVEVHMENRKTLYDASRNLDLIKPTAENTIFQGFADEDQMAFDDSTRTIRLRGRDFTSLFVDAPWRATALPLDKPVDQILSDILTTLKAAGDITVDNRTGVITLPILAQYYPDFGGTQSGKRNARKNETYWDVIQDIVQKAGLIAYIELDKLVLTKPRNLFDANQSVRFVMGKNLKNLEITRKLAKQKGFNVEVRSVVGKQVLVAKIPLEAKNIEGAGIEVLIDKQGVRGRVEDKEPAPYLTFFVANVTSKNHLIEVGEKVFEELGRQQIEGRFTTMDMEAPTDNQECFDLLKLRNGTPIRVVIDVDDLQQIKQQATVAQRIRYLKARCYPESIAKIFAETMGKFSTPFYTRSVEYSIDSETGFKIDVDFVNFIETENKGLGL